MNAQLGPIKVVITEVHHGRIPDGEPIPSVRLADFTFDPLVSRSIDETTLQLRDLPPLLISLGYAAHTGGISLFIQQSGREVVDLGNFAPTTNSYLGVPLSQDTSLSVHFNRERQ